MDSQTFTLDYTYNSLGHLSSTIYPSSASIAYAPNAFGEAVQAGSYATAATYHPNGMVKSHNYGNGFAHTTTQTSAGLPNTWYDVRSSTYAINYGFSYDANSNITFWDDKVNNAYDMQATYDGLDRLDTLPDSYDGVGNVNYDTMGNITYYQLGSRTLSYTYNGNKQLTSTSGHKSYSFSYDDRGNVTNNGTRAFTYNAANQMVTSGGYSYLYDGNDKRVKQVDGHGTSYSFYAGNGKLMYRKEGSSHVDYYYLGGKLVAKKKGGAVTYLHADYLGSTSAESNTSGTVTSRMHYRPFGEPIEAPAKDDVGYTGHKYDTDLGLSYMQARYYDPLVARFYGSDPVGFSAEKSFLFGRYTYGINNPFRFTDPDGRCSVDMASSKSLCAIQDAMINFIEPIIERSMKKSGIDVVPEDQRDPSGEYSNKANESSVSEEIGAIGAAIITAGVTRAAGGKRSKVDKSKTTTAIGDRFTKTTEVRPGSGPGQSRAEYTRYKNEKGDVIRTHKDTYDRAGRFQHRKPITGGPEGRREGDPQ